MFGGAFSKADGSLLLCGQLIGGADKKIFSNSLRKGTQKI